MAKGKLLRCPKCGGQDVRPSYHRGIADDIMMILSMTGFRCRACGKRFFRRTPHSEPGFWRA
jgi:DNA-directed RNA polymerase subunit RPC12/RpoP